MKHLKRMLALILAAALVLTGCGGKKGEEETSEGATQTEAAQPANYTFDLNDGKTYHIGVLQQADHQALNRAVESFKGNLESILNYDVTVTVLCGNNDMEECERIARSYTEAGMDLILCAGTGALQAAASVTSTTPIMGVGITDFVSSGTAEANDNPGGNVTGVACLPPLDDLYEALNLMTATGEKFALVYSEDETNSVFQIHMMTQLLEADGKEAVTDYITYPVSSDSQLEETLRKACEECGSVFIPMDNRIACRMDLVNKIAAETYTPVMTPDSNMCRAGGFAAVSIDFGAAGVIVSELVAELLKGERITVNTHIRTLLETTVYVYNPRTADQIGRMGPYNYTAQDVPVTETEVQTGEGSEEP